MNDKKLLVILLLFGTYIFITKPLTDKLPLETLQLKNLQREIAKEEFIKHKSQQINKLYPKYMEISKQNKKLFFSSNISVSTAMSNMQNFIKKASKKSRLQLTRVNWGSQIDKDEYFILPMSFTVKGSPPQLNTFLMNLLKFNKLLRFESISISSSVYSYKISFNAIIKCFKLKKVEK